MKIVRKSDGDGGVVMFWLDTENVIRCDLAKYPGWPVNQPKHHFKVTDQWAEMCGTTLAALRAELTEEGGDGGR
jgi:hypothetical protein